MGDTLGGWICGINAKIDRDRYFATVDLIAADDNGGGGDFLFVQPCAVGGTKILQPPLTMMIGQARMAYRYRVIEQGNVAMGVASKQDLRLCDMALGGSLIADLKVQANAWDFSRG